VCDVVWGGGPGMGDRGEGVKIGQK